MTTSNFLIGPIGEGLNQNVKPFASPEDSFEVMTNAYQWRGRVVRRAGYTLLGNLSNGTPVMGLATQEEFAINAQNLMAFDTTNSYQYNGTIFVKTKFFRGDGTSTDALWSGTDYQFFWTTNYAGAFWATNSKPGLHAYTITLFSNAVGFGLAATVDVTAAGNNFVVGDFVYFLHVTGTGFENNLAYGVVTVAGNPTFTVQSLIDDPTFTFVNGAPTTGMVLSSTANKAGEDGIRYFGDLSYNGLAQHTSWANYNPPVDPDNALVGALLIFPYRGYLVFLNTTEGNEQGVFNHGNRARWIQIGTPYYSNPVPATPSLQGIDPKAARDDLFGRGGANDASTNEVIVAAGFIRDILVVYFERSTWRLRFVNNAQNPFVWERVNVELGSDCTFSVIPFDKGLMAIGNRGIVISDGNDTIRFDEKIPDDIFTIRQNNNGFQRVQSIRTFRTKLNFWTFPNSQINPDGIYPDSVLVFNYETKNWSFFDDCFTTFGYFYPTNTGTRWIDLPNPWTDYNEQSAADGITQKGQETIVAGNQQGFVFKLEQTNSTNDPSLNIANIVGSTVTINDHNLQDGYWIRITGVTGTTNADGTSLNNRNYKVSLTTQNTFDINEFESIDGGNAVGTSYTYDVDWVPILAGSVQINVGAVEFRDANIDGILTSAGADTGVINYSTGLLRLQFAVPILSTPVVIRIVSVDPEQDIIPVETIVAYTGSGQMAKISGYDVQSKAFNFFGQDKRARLSKIDFYVDKTAHGQFTTNIFADSDNVPINTPLGDNPQSNVVLTTVNPYQIASGTDTIYRLFADCLAQTIQVQLTLSDNQMAVTAINSEDIEVSAMIFTLRQGGRLV